MTTPEMKPLLPCPFCGGDPFFPEIDDPDEDFAWMIRCRQCGCQLDGFQDEAAARGGWDSRNSPTPAKEPSGELEKAFSEAADFAIIVLQEVCYHFNGLEQQGVEWAKDNALWIRADGALKALNVPMQAYRAQVTKEGE